MVIVSIDIFFIVFLLRIIEKLEPITISNNLLQSFDPMKSMAVLYLIIEFFNFQYRI